MRLKLDFEKEENDCWYAVVPSWPGEHSALEMVSGADTLLDYLDKGKRYIRIDVDTEPNEKFNELELMEESYGGGVYLDKYTGKQLWLCSVTKFVLNEIPKKIWYKKI